MIRSLYGRLLAFQLLTVILGAFTFWLVADKLNMPEPFSLIITATVLMVVAAVVVGVLLSPLDHVVLAIRHLASGEDVPLPALRGKDGQQMAEALGRLRERVITGPAAAAQAATAPVAAAPTPAPAAAPAPVAAPSQPAMSSVQSARAEIIDVLNGLSEGIMIQDMSFKPAITNTALRLMASVDQAPSGTGSLVDDPTRYRHAFHDRCFVPDQLAVIEEQMAKNPDRPRTDIVQLERPRQFLRRYAAPLYNEKHEQTGYLVSYQDITHEVEQDRLRQDFIANASHELRTPVTSVKVLLENLVDGAKDDPNVRDEFLDDALHEIDRMHELVNDLLDMAALEAGRHNLTFTTFDATKVVAEAIATVAPQAKQRDVNLEADLPDGGELPMEADRQRLRQVLVNLVANAVKFTPAGGDVRLKAWRDGEFMRFQVSDTGIGIPAQDLPHIFDRFFRVTRARSRMQGGSGLGLTITKNAVDAHRGEIHVESTENVGTTVFIKLPVSQKEVEA